MARSDEFSLEGLKEYARQKGFSQVAVGGAWNRSQRDLKDRKGDFQAEVTREEFLAFCEELSGGDAPQNYGRILGPLLQSWAAHLTEKKY